MKHSFRGLWAAAVLGGILSVWASANAQTPHRGGHGAAPHRGQAPAANATANPAATPAAPRHRGHAAGTPHQPGHGARHHGHAHHHHHHHRSRVGVAGAPLFVAPWWHYSDPFFHAPYVPPPPVTYTYIEQAAPEQPYWHYCEASQTYFPYVQTCATPWVRVIPHAPPQ